MYPTIIDFGAFGIHSYGVMLATAFITIVFILQYELKRRGFVEELAGAIVMATALGGIVGAKLYSAFSDGSISFRELFSTTGLVWYGGFIGGCIAGMIVVARSPSPFLATIDLVGPTLLLGYGIGRIGCLLAGDGDYGPPSDLPWAMAFPNGTVPTDVPVHPTPIYESLMSFTLFGVLWSQRRKFEDIPGTNLRHQSYVVGDRAVYSGVLAHYAERVGLDVGGTDFQYCCLCRWHRANFLAAYASPCGQR